jgi:hypothetical protein
VRTTPCQVGFQGSWLTEVILAGAWAPVGKGAGKDRAGKGDSGIVRPNEPLVRHEVAEVTTVLQCARGSGEPMGNRGAGSV